MTDIVERLRGRLRGMWPLDETLKEAADEIERLRQNNERLHQACDGYLGELAAMRANKDDEIERLEAELTKVLEALEKIAFPPEDIDVPHYPVSIARAALQPDPVWVYPGCEADQINENQRLRTENAKLREALEKISGTHAHFTFDTAENKCQEFRKIARAALTLHSKSESADHNKE